MVQQKRYSMEKAREHLDKNKQLQVVELPSDLTDKVGDLIRRTIHSESASPSFCGAGYHAPATIDDCNFIAADRGHCEKAKELDKIKLLAEVA